MKYIIDTDKKTIEFISLSSSEIIELATKYPDFEFKPKSEVINIPIGTNEGYEKIPYWLNPNVPFSQPDYNGTDITLCGTSSGKWQFGSTTTLNHCQGGTTLSTFSGTAKCLN